MHVDSYTTSTYDAFINLIYLIAYIYRMDFCKKNYV